MVSYYFAAVDIYYSQIKPLIYFIKIRSLLGKFTYSGEKTHHMVQNRSITPFIMSERSSGSKISK